MIRAAGRDPASVGLEVWVSPGIGKAEDWRREISFWKKAGVTHVNAHTSYVSAHPQAHRRQELRRPPRRHHALPRGGGGPAVERITSPIQAPLPRKGERNMKER